MAVSQREIIQHYRSREQQASQALVAYRELRDQVEQQLKATELDCAKAWTALAQAYLPQLDTSHLQEAERLTGFRGFSRRDPLAALQKETAARSKRIARIRADERYVRRQFIVGPAGELTLGLKEARSMLEPWELECRRFESLSHFDELIEANYDTPEFSASFLSAQYWRLWKAGDAACEAMGYDDFGEDLLPVYTKAAAERHRWLQEVRRWEGKVDAVHELVREHDTAVAELPKLPQQILETCWQGLSEYLAHADVGLLEMWLGQEPDRAMLGALRRAAGLHAKQQILMELYSKGLTELISSLESRQSKYARKATKYGRSKYAYQSFGESDMDMKFEEKVGKLERERRKTQDLLNKMMAYEQYERFELSNDPDLWWWEMTGKRPSRYTPRLRSWYQKNPQVRVARDTPSGQVVARAAVARELDSADYLS